MVIETHRLAAFFAGLIEVLKVARTAQATIDRRLATRFSIFRQLKTGEHALSNIVSELLNPAGSHGQGDVLLKEFLAMLNISSDEFDLSSCRIAREWTAPVGDALRPLDILVEFGRPAVTGIAVENKPWAGEQPEQMKHYVSYMSERFGDGPWLVIYLSADGEGPNSIEKAEWDALKAKSKTMVLPYVESASGHSHSLVGWLDRCAERCEANYVRDIVRDLTRFLREEMGPAGRGEGTVADETANGVIETYILANESHLENALAIEQAMEGVKRRLVTALLDKLKAYVLDKLGEGWEARSEEEYGIMGRYANLVFRRSSWPESKGLVGAAIESEKRGWSHVIIGIRAHRDEEGCNRAELTDRALELLPGSDRNEWWPSFSYLDPYKDWQSMEMQRAGIRCLKMDQDVPEIEEIGNKLVALAKVVESVLDADQRAHGTQS